MMLLNLGLPRVGLFKWFCMVGMEKFIASYFCVLNARGNDMFTMEIMLLVIQAMCAYTIGEFVSYLHVIIQVGIEKRLCYLVFLQRYLYL